MARYSKEHKEETRQAIVATASGAMRSRGIDGAGLADIMGRAGLTHGGFYTHFDSKEDLTAAVCETGVAEAGSALFEIARAVPPAERVEAMLQAYLTETRRNAREQGCTLAMLGGEIARQSPGVRRRFTRAFQQVVERVAGVLPGADEDTRRDQSLALLSGMIGAMVLARAVSDRDLSDRLLDVGRRAFPAVVDHMNSASSRQDPGRERGN